MVSYAEIYYDEPVYYRTAQPTQKFQLDAVHFIIIYIFALFIMTFANK